MREEGKKIEMVDCGDEMAELVSKKGIRENVFRHMIMYSVAMPPICHQKKKH